MPPLPIIRPYDPLRDHAPFLTCIIVLQDSERRLEPDLPPGAEMAHAWREHLLHHCTAPRGQIYVAAHDQTLAGYIAIIDDVPPAGADDEQAPYTYINDLVVLPEYRQQGLGRALLEQAETYARARGATQLRLRALSKNQPAARLYRTLGFTDYRIELVKRLPERYRNAQRLG